MSRGFSKICLMTLVFTFCMGIMSAQKIPIFKDPDVDSVYIDLLPGKWSLRAFASAPYQALSIKNNQNQVVKYIPNNLVGVGLGFSYRFIILDLGFNIKSNKSNATSRFDLQMNVLLQKHHAHLYLQTYQGFELAKSPFGKNKFRDDLRSSTFGLNYSYNFNHKKLSIRSAFSGDQLQRKSSGTLALGGYYSYYKLQADSSIIDFDNQAYYNKYSHIQETELFEMGVSAGYAFSLILPKNFFLYSSIMPGLGINLGKVIASEVDYTPPLGPVAKVRLRTSFGYSNKRVYSFISFISDNFFIDLGHQNHFRYSPGKIKLVFGYRLQSKVKFLEKVNDQFKIN